MSGPLYTKEKRPQFPLESKMGRRRTCLGAVAELNPFQELNLIHSVTNDCTVLARVAVTVLNNALMLYILSY